MKHTKITLVAVFTAVLVTGIFFSCTKENQNSKAEQTANVECKNRDDLSRYNELLNDYYQYCIAAFLTDSATFMDSCSLESPEAFYHVTGIPAILIEEMGELADYLWPELPGVGDNDPASGPGSDPDYCAECEGTSYVELGNNMIALYHLAEEIAELDPFFDVDNPLTARPNDPCKNNCRDHVLHSPEWDTCVLFCFSSINIGRLQAYLEFLHELLYQ